jgi:ABC-type uncharacterized transport system substrate-binding protein
MPTRKWLETAKFRSDNGKLATQNLNLLWLSVITFVLVICGAVVEAQQFTQLPRIGFLTVATPAILAARIDAFRQGLRELGYVEGKNIAIEWRFAEGRLDRQSDLAAELVHLNVDVLVTSGATVTRAAKEVTTKIPIVMGQDSDPVGSGFVASLARPGGNITGLSTLAPEITGKRLEILKEIIPKLSRVAVLGSSTEPGYAQVLKEMDLAAEVLRLRLQFVDVLGAKDFQTGFRQVSNGRPDGMVVLNSAVFISQRPKVVEFGAKNRLPAMYSNSEFVNDGGLMTYGVSFTDLFRRAATYVDKILKGAKPADLPVEQPKKFEFIINLKAAKQIGLTIPPNVLARADKVIR